MLARMRYPEFPEPMGVLRAVEKPTYDEQVNQQVEDAIAEKGEGDLDKILNRGDTWEVK
jgi:2-oxoglutarate ferredoxin oxidoreductase subunit beta